MDILLVSYQHDPAVTQVSHHLTDLGFRPCLWMTDRYPQHQPMSWLLDNQVPFGTPRSQLTIGQEVLDLSVLGAAWYRRVNIDRGLRLPDPQVKKASVTEATLHLKYTLDRLPCPVLHRPLINERAKNKLWQLERAVAAGLQIPPTLCTNDPERALEFYRDHASQAVVKMISPFAIVRDDRPQVFFTSRVDERMVRDLGHLPNCPMVFQANIPKALELRVTVVGGQVFAAAVDSQQLSAARTDWRVAGDELAQLWSTYDLPVEVARKLLWLVADLGLNYGAIDLILTPEGEYVFLEVNPAGEYLWLERSAGLPISAAIAETLADMATSFYQELGVGQVACD